MAKDLIIVSGGFDPLHRGHVSLILDAGKRGDVAICLNSDAWLTRKKGKPFMTYADRCAVVGAIRGVVDVVAMNDDDGSACDGIRIIRAKYPTRSMCFANGGDRNTNSTPTREQSTCAELGIKLLWNVGGSDKPQSSSWILNNWNSNSSK